MPRARVPTIYFIQRGEGGLIKIGFTLRSTQRRLSELQVGCPETLHLLAESPGTEAHEDVLHLHFAAAWKRGEWFEPVPELLDMINAISFGDLELANFVNTLPDGSSEIP